MYTGGEVSEANMRSQSTRERQHPVQNKVASTERTIRKIIHGIKGRKVRPERGDIEKGREREGEIQRQMGREIKIEIKRQTTRDVHRDTETEMERGTESYRDRWGERGGG
jgi:hypothetical protein